jgi:ferric-dicitrate binding protein FerR (iron transport regulator)
MKKPRLKHDEISRRLLALGYKSSSPAVASKRGELRARRPSSLRRLWPGEATLLAAAVLWLLVLLYVGIGEWRRMVHDSRTDVGEIGER